MSGSRGRPGNTNQDVTLAENATVWVKNSSGGIVRKEVREVQLGDMVQFVNEMPFRRVCNIQYDRYRGYTLTTTNDDDDGCFAEDSLVLVMNESGEKVLKEIREVQVGDKVESVDPKTGLLTFSEVCFVQHDDDPNAEKQILNIKFQTDLNQEENLRITPNHLLYVSKGKHEPLSHPLKNPLTANKVEVGDFLWQRSDEKFRPCRVTSITPQENVRIINPITMNHHIVVNGVHASVHVVNEKLWRFLTSSFRMFYSLHPSICTSKVLKSANKQFYKKSKNQVSDQALKQNLNQTV